LNYKVFLLAVKLSQIGERAIIKKIIDIIEDENIGDDAAYIQYGDEFLLLTTDIVRKKTHLPDIMQPFDIGWFVTAINLSDIAAMGGEPLGVLLSMAIPRELDEKFVIELVQGAKSCTSMYNTSIIGGDTKEHDEITICGTAIGRVKREEILLRKGARPGDILAVTGELGKAAAALLAINEGLSDIDTDALVRPIPRIKEARAIAEHRFANACMDISDGLSSTLYQLREINDVGFLIDRDKLPISKEAIRVGKRLNINPHSIALDYGGDYELLFIMPKNGFKEAKKKVPEVKLTEIGEVIEDKEIKIICHGIERRLEKRGYEHFVS